MNNLIQSPPGNMGGFLFKQSVERWLHRKLLILRKDAQAIRFCYTFAK